MLSELSLFLYDFADVWEYQRTGGNVRGGGGGSSLARLCKCVGGSQE